MFMKFVAIVFLLTVSHISFAQKIHMDVLMGDEKIGYIDAEKKTKGSNVQYEMTSNVEATMIITVKVNTTTNTWWYDGTLTVSHATRTSNVPGQSLNTSVNLKGDVYQVKRNSKETTQSVPVKFCVTNMYFQEPVKEETVFSEMQGSYLNLIHQPNHKYDVIQPNGKKESYSYVDGKLQKIESVIAGKNVVFLVK